MSIELIKSIFFGLGIATQVISLIGYKLNKKDFREILKDIAGGFLFVFYAVYIFIGESEPNLSAIITASLYIFYLGFGASFTLSFKKKISLRISEINLITINILFLYYCITQIGFDNFFSKLIYIPTFITLAIFFLKRELANRHKAFLYLWYMILFMMLSIINIFQILNNGDNVFSSYLSSFFIGGIFLYIWIYFIFLVMLVNILDFFLNKKRPDAYRGRIAFNEHFLYLASSFNKTKSSKLYTWILFALFSSFLVLNYYNHYISETSLVVFILFFASMSSSRKIDLTKKDIK